MFTIRNTAGGRDTVQGSVPEVDNPEHDEFTGQVKLEPFARAMSCVSPDYWVTAIRKDQVAFRQGLEVISRTREGFTG